MGLSELGLVDCDADQAAEWLRVWHGTPDPEALIELRVWGAHPWQRRGRAVHAAAWALRGDGQRLAEFVGYTEWQRNVYCTLGQLRSAGSGVIARVPGLWLDLDVKPGGFRDERHALAWLNTALPDTTLAVATGLGGVHAYWRTEALTPQEYTELARRWMQYGQSAAPEGVKIDTNLYDAQRVTKLPGTIRWPKQRGERPAAVRLLWSDGPAYEAQDLADLAPALPPDARRDGPDAPTPSGWVDLQAAADEAESARLMSWPEVLEPHGWRYLRTDHEERAEWAHPTSERKSASTRGGWMTLFSDSADTGLQGLVGDRPLPLTLRKGEVWSELNA